MTGIRHPRSLSYRLSAFIALLALVLVAGCSGKAPRDGASRDAGPSRPPAGLDAIPDAVPRTESASRYGNPREYVVFGRRYRTLETSAGYDKTGYASWYGTKFHGQRTSSGEAYDMYAMTAAHKSLPLPSYVEVENLDNRRRVVLRVNDRGPFVDGRIIDLSYAAAHRLDMANRGIARVRVRAVGPPVRMSWAGPAGPAQAVASNPPVGSRPVFQPIPDEDDVSEPSNAIELPAIAERGNPRGGRFIQVGAFGLRENAEEVSDDMQRAGIGPMRILDGTAGGRPIYRLRIGPLADAAAVHDAKERLARMAHVDYRVLDE